MKCTFYANFTLNLLSCKPLKNPTEKIANKNYHLFKFPILKRVIQ